MYIHTTIIIYSVQLRIGELCLIFFCAIYYANNVQYVHNYAGQKVMLIIILNHMAPEYVQYQLLLKHMASEQPEWKECAVFLKTFLVITRTELQKTTSNYIGIIKDFCSH